MPESSVRMSNYSTVQQLKCLLSKPTNPLHRFDSKETVEMIRSETSAEEEDHAVL